MLKHNRPGQTMLEMVIAIGVITVSTLATTGLIISTITAGRISQNKIEAANIAREGVEIVRMYRDSNYLLRDQNIQENNANNGGLPAPIEWDDAFQRFQQPGNCFCGLASNCFTICQASITLQPRYYTVDMVPTSGPRLRLCRYPSSGVPTPNAECTGADADYFLDTTIIKEQTVPTLNQRFFIQTTSTLGSIVSTKYSRIIRIEKKFENVTLGSGVTSETKIIEYLDVTSTVKWKERTGTKIMVAQERLYNWR